MWNKDQNGQWQRNESVFSSVEFERTLSRLKTYAKCVNASTYSVTNKIDNIYSEILYQHGFYVQFLDTAPDKLIISDVVLEKNKMYNLSLTHPKETIIENQLDYLIEETNDGVLKMSIRTAIVLNYIKAANSDLFQSACGFTYWEDYISYDSFENSSNDLSCYNAGTNGSGTNGTNGQIIPSILEPIETIILNPYYTEKDVYDVWNNNLEKQGWSLSTYWTPDKTINNLLNNFRLIDLASTENIDITEEWFNLVIDNKQVQEGHLVLVKNQINSTENGIYIFTNRFLVRSNIFDNIEDREYFSVFIKIGQTNKEKQYFLERLQNGEYPYLNGTNGTAINFIEGTNYVIRNRVDYKLLADNAYNNTAVHIDKNPVLFEYEKFDLSVKADQYTYKVSTNANWIERIEDNLNIGLLNEFGTSGTSGNFIPLNLLFRLNSDNNKVLYINISNGVYNLYELDPLTNLSVLKYSTTEIIRDFTLDVNNLYFLIEDNSTNTSNKIVVYDKNSLVILNEYIIPYSINEFKVLTVDLETWYFFITNDSVIQWHPIFGKNVISEEIAKYLIVNLDLRENIQQSLVNISQQDIISPIELKPLDPSISDAFGNSVDFTNQFAIIGAPGKESSVSGALNSGAAYIFENSGTSGWSQINKFESLNGQAADSFGQSVVIDNDIIIIGVPGENALEGSVHVYQYTNNIWNLREIITNPNNTPGEEFGNTVVIDQNTLVIGAPASETVYVYEKIFNGTSGTSALTYTWTNTQQLIASNSNISDKFGQSIHLNGQLLIIGTDSGDQAYVFKKELGVWVEKQILVPLDSPTAPNFGISVYIDDVYAFVGANGRSGGGAVYVFKRLDINVDTWTQVSIVTSTNSSIALQLGSSITYNGSQLLVGAPGEDTIFSNSGAVLVFEEQGINNWQVVDTLKSINPAVAAEFGWNIKSNNDLVIVGERNVSSSGTSYIMQTIVLGPPEGTDGTAGRGDQFVQLSWIQQEIKSPTRVEKNSIYLTDYFTWNKQPEFIINDTFSKTTHGDWKIENDTLKLKGINILSQGTSGFKDIPKIGNDISRYFDGKDDHILFSEISFTNISDFSIEFIINPIATKTNSRVFYFGSSRESTIISNVDAQRGDDLQSVVIAQSSDYDSVEFIINDTDTGKPKFQIKDKDNYLVINSNTDLELDTDTKVTITVDFSNSSDDAIPYNYTARIWFNDDIVGTASGRFTKTISELRPLVEAFIGKSSSAQDPLYVGNIKEFRVSDIVLNPAQIASRYIPIEEGDITYPNLLYYWNLLDTTAFIKDSIDKINGAFIGGLFFDPTLQLITNPIQILISEDNTYLYILTRDNVSELPPDTTSGTNGTNGELLPDTTSGNGTDGNGTDGNGTNGELPPDTTSGNGTNGSTLITNIFRINLNTEDVDLLITDDNIQSIYVENNALYWLVNEQIFKLNESTPVVTNAADAIDFAIVFNKIFYITSSLNIYDEHNHLVFQVNITQQNTVTNFLSLTLFELFYGQYQTYNNESWYNIYVKKLDGKILILSGQFDNVLTDNLQLRGTFPFYLTNTNETIIKSIELNGQVYSITSNNRIITIINNIIIDLDPTNKYWNWNLNQLFGLNGHDNFLYIGAINTSNDVQIWRFDLNTSTALLLRKENRTSLFNAGDNLELDLIVTNTTDPRLFIIKPDGIVIEVYKVNKDLVSLESLESEIVLEINGKLIQLDAINENSFFYINRRDGINWLGLANTSSGYDFWKESLEYNNNIHNIWIGDFGVALKRNTDASTSGHTLDLLETFVKWNFLDITLDIDNTLNNHNYIIPTWTGQAWIYGQDGNCIKTSNFGENWNVIETNTFSSLNNSSYNLNNGLIIGKNSTILQTTSYGEFYTTLNVEQNNINNRELTDVLIYAKDKALIVGKAGLILHLQFINNNWIINNNILNKTVDVVIQDDLENIIKPILVNNDEESILRTNYSKIVYLNNEFWLFGDRSYIARLKLQFNDGHIKPFFTFYQDNTFNAPIIDAHEMIDYIDGVSKFIISTAENIKLFTIQGSVAVENSNLFKINLENIELENIDFEIKTSGYQDNQILYLAGFDGSIKEGILQDKTILERFNIVDLTFVDQILDEYFKPRMLITDYYLARKINILLRDGNYIIPSANIPKSILSCVNGVKPLFYEDEWLEFSTTSNSAQPNYLAYQDWYYTTRRLTLLDSTGINSDGLTKYFPYNKRFIAKDDLSNYTWSKTIDSTTGFLPNGINTTIKNELWSGSNFPEKYFHTVIYVDNTFIVEPNDVIELKIFRDSIGSNNVPFTDLLLNDKFIVQDVNNIAGNKKKVILWELLDSDILADFEPAATVGYVDWTIQLENLNYFNGHLNDLQTKIQKHFVGDAYQIQIDILDIIPIKGIVNSETKYANLETVITTYTSADTPAALERTFNIKYADNIIYGPDYNLYKFLNTLDPIFNSEYEFKNIVFTGQINAINGTLELSISKNIIYAGEIHVDKLLQFAAGTWVDISRNNDKVDRIFIEDIELTEQTGNRRLKMSFDTNLDDRFVDDFISTLKIESRFKLSQISSDLNWTDNINFPTPATDGMFGTNGIFVSNEQQGSYYHGYHNYLRTATEYSKVLLDNEDIKSVISAAVWVDDANDLKLNVYNWQNDPNFAFRPIDLHVVGIDAAEDDLLDFYDAALDGKPIFNFSSKREFGLKKAISVLPINWNITDNFFALFDIDLTKYNFILTDGLTLQELNDKYFWILNADIRQAVIGVETDTNDLELLKWYQGDWICGTWENGKWYSGTVFNIKWITGEWFSHSAIDNFNVWEIDFTVDDKNLSQWFNGKWGSGIWHNGIWFNGTWFNGTHISGDWFDGTWLNGEWQNGLWSGGTWKNGTWLNGVWNTDNVESFWENGTWLGGDFENGVWINGIWDQGAGKISRFGTKSTSVQQSIWQYGIWKNGQFHTFLNLNEDNEPIASTQYRDSIWFNGVWLAGNWYGGTWESGRWENGIWHFGLWRSLQNLIRVEKVTLEEEGVETIVESRLKFSNPHYYKLTSESLDFDNQSPENLNNKYVNRATVIGEPNVNSGFLPELVEDLGWNSFSGQHAVKIIDEYSLSIQHLQSGIYSDRILRGDTFFIGGTNGTSGAGTNGTSGIEICIDENIVVPMPPIVEIYDTRSTYDSEPAVVSHWVDGTWISGIWEQGYWGNGRWLGGIWVDGVWERGVFGS